MSVTAFAEPRHAAGQGALQESSWPVVELRLHDANDVEALPDALARVLEREEPFALLVEGPADLACLQRLIAAAPDARRRLRRLRPALGAWCAGAVQVVRPEDLPEETWPAEMIWGCAATARTARGEALDWLDARLAAR